MKTNLCKFDDLISAWTSRVVEDPNKLALIADETRWSRIALNNRIQSCVSWLKGFGLSSGDRIILMLNNGADFICLFFACQRIGIVPVPLSPKTSIKRLTYIQEDCGCNRVILAPNHPMLRNAFLNGLTELPIEWPQPTEIHDPHPPERLGLIQYTSGSTSHSKGVMVSQKAILANICSFAPTMNLGPDSIFSSLMPLFHDMGLIAFGLAPLLLGHPLCLHNQEATSLFEWLDGISAHRVTHTGGSDALLRIACRVSGDPERYDLSSLKMLICGSEPVLLSTLEAFEAKFQVPGRLYPAYGMAELTLCATATPMGESWRKDSHGHVSSGRPVANVDVKIVPPEGTGEIFVRSPAVMDGYFNRHDNNVDAEGFLATGDLGYQDQDGYLFVLGRIKNLIIRNGTKYCPHDLEEVALTTSEIRKAAVVQLDPTPGLDSVILAVLEVHRFLLSDTDALAKLAQTINLGCSQATGLAPDQVWFVRGGAIPITENGKVKHRILVQEITSGLFKPIRCFPERTAPESPVA